MSGCAGSINHLWRLAVTGHLGRPVTNVVSLSLGRARSISGGPCTRLDSCTVHVPWSAAARSAPLTSHGGHTASAPLPAHRAAPLRATHHVRDESRLARAGACAVLSRSATPGAPDSAIKTLPIKDTVCNLAIYSSRGLDMLTGAMRSPCMSGCVSGWSWGLEVGRAVPESVVTALGRVYGRAASAYTALVRHSGGAVRRGRKTTNEPGCKNKREGRRGTVIGTDQHRPTLAYTDLH